MGGRIFISYRREDTEGYAGRIYDHLSKHFGSDRVFMDVDDIALGENFVEVIEQAVSSCNVLIALIGNRWMSAVDEDGNLRLKDPKDFVRLEIASALRKGTRVIPVLVHSATMPGWDSLPEDLAPLTHRNALQISHSRFIADVDRLTEELEKIFIQCGESVKAPKPKNILKAIPVWGWISLAAIVLLIGSLALSGVFSKELQETPVAQVVQSDTPRPSITPLPTQTATQTQPPPTLTETASSAIEIIPTETPTPTSTAMPTISTSITVQRGDRNVEMVLVADCLLDESGKYDEKNCDLSINGDDLKNAFYLDRFPVTNEQFAAFLNQESNDSNKIGDWFDSDHPYLRIAKNDDTGQWYREDGFENYPVVAVSWTGAYQFCDSFAGGSLPTEEQWVKAARGNTGNVYPWGNLIDTAHANFDPSDGVTSVGGYANDGSPFHVRSMVGNVWEWMKDTREAGAKAKVKGGSYRSGSEELKIDYPGRWVSISNTDRDLGFRCLCAPAIKCYSDLVPTPTPNP